MSAGNTDASSPADVAPGDAAPRDGNPHQAYYAQARSWAEDRDTAMQRSRRLAWLLAGGAAAIAALEALALVALAPLKTVVPYTLLVDRNTGYVEALDPAHPTMIKPQAALTQALLAQYVVARETFDINSLPDQYQKVALWSAEAARRDYLGAMTRDNPDNPISRYPRNALVKTQVESVSPLGTNTALVRFYTEQYDSTQGPRPRAFWAAVVRFRFSGEPMALADRLVNPLGFQVVQYRRDQEAPPPEPVATVPAAPAPAVIARPYALPAGPALPNEARRVYPHPAEQVPAPSVVQTL